jgi:glutamyl-tRNA synthetase
VFHLVNVVDDSEMNITHVIRGEDHLSNTAKHIALFRAFGVAPPKYAHIPLILNIDGTKMSKRDKGASLMAYSEEGYVPAALVNYLCLLGWSPKNNREKMALAEVVEAFDLPQILRHNARFDLTKLIWLNGEYVRELDDAKFYEQSTEALTRAGLDLKKYPAEYVKAALETCKGKFKLFGELPAYAGFYFKEEIEYDPVSVQKDFTPENKPRLAKLREALAKLEPFEADPIGVTLKAVAQELGVKAGVLVHPTRLACCGNPAGPSLYHLLAILGKQRALARIDRALARMG